MSERRSHASEEDAQWSPEQRIFEGFPAPGEEPQIAPEEVSQDPHDLLVKSGTLQKGQAWFDELGVQFEPYLEDTADSRAADIYTEGATSSLKYKPGEEHDDTPTSIVTVPQAPARRTEVNTEGRPYIRYSRYTQRYWGMWLGGWLRNHMKDKNGNGGIKPVRKYVGYINTIVPGLGDQLDEVVEERAKAIAADLKSRAPKGYTATVFDEFAIRPPDDDVDLLREYLADEDLKAYAAARGHDSLLRLIGDAARNKDFRFNLREYQKWAGPRTIKELAGIIGDEEPTTPEQALERDLASLVVLGSTGYVADLYRDRKVSIKEIEQWLRRPVLSPSAREDGLILYTKPGTPAHALVTNLQDTIRPKQANGKDNPDYAPLYDFRNNPPHTLANRQALGRILLTQDPDDPQVILHSWEGKGSFHAVKRMPWGALSNVEQDLFNAKEPSSQAVKQLAHGSFAAFTLLSNLMTYSDEDREKFGGLKNFMNAQRTDPGDVRGIRPPNQAIADAYQLVRPLLHEPNMHYVIQAYIPVLYDNKRAYNLLAGVTREPEKVRTKHVIHAISPQMHLRAISDTPATIVRNIQEFGAR